MRFRCIESSFEEPEVELEMYPGEHVSPPPPQCLPRLHTGMRRRRLWRGSKKQEVKASRSSRSVADRPGRVKERNSRHPRNESLPFGEEKNKTKNRGRILRRESLASFELKKNLGTDIAPRFLPPQQTPQPNDPLSSKTEPRSPPPQTS